MENVAENLLLWCLEIMKMFFCYQATGRMLRLLLHLEKENKSKNHILKVELNV